MNSAPSTYKPLKLIDVISLLSTPIRTQNSYFNIYNSYFLTIFLGIPLLFEVECVIDGYNSKASTESPFYSTFKFDSGITEDACVNDSQAIWKAKFDHGR